MVSNSSTHDQHASRTVAGVIPSQQHQQDTTAPSSLSIATTKKLSEYHRRRTWLGKSEYALCGMGDGWGYLKDKPASWMGIWWAMRHFLYFGGSALLLLFVTGSSYFVVPFFLFAHAYKAVRAAILGSAPKTRTSTTAPRESVSPKSPLSHEEESHITKNDDTDKDQNIDLEKGNEKPVGSVSG